VATFVIVPAVYSGGWTWKQVRVGLRAAGHEVYAVTLTGLGERTHLATPEVGLDTHIQDVMNVLECEDLRDVVLLGHSYGGMVIAAVADRAADRLAQQVYLDALIPCDGESAFDLLPTWRPMWEKVAGERGEGWRVFPPGFMTEQRYRPQPLRCFQQPVRLAATGSRSVPGVYIECTEKAPDEGLVRAIALSAARARERDWPILELEANHNAPATAPQALVEVLLKVV